MTRTKGSVAFASAGVKNFGLALASDIAVQVEAGVGAGVGVGLTAGAGLGGGGGSGGLTHTGSLTIFDAATAVGLSDAWPHATSIGSFAKSTMQPSRL